MTTATAASRVTVADLVSQLGDIPTTRIRLHPHPGTATEADLLAAAAREDQLFELVDGTLVEKPMGMKEGALAQRLGRFVANFADPLRLGEVFGADSPMRLMPKQVRLPDVSFVCIDRLPGGCYPEEPIPDLYPDLAVEVLSPSNTAREMERKVREYFFAGTRLVWLVDPEARTVRVHTSPDDSVLLTEADSLDGGDLLPGFSLPLADLFARLPRRP